MEQNVKKLYRSNNDYVFAGICGGLGEYFAIDSTLVRVIYTALALMTGGGLFILYLFLLLIIPLEPENVAVAKKTKSKKSK